VIPIHMEKKDKMAEVQDEIDKTKKTVEQGIQLAIDRGDKLEELDDKASNLTNEANMFNRKAKQVNRHFCLQKWKMYALIAFIFILVILIIVLVVTRRKKK